MIALSLNLDQSRMIEQQWLPYMIKNAWAHLRSNTGNQGKYLNCKIVITLLCQVHKAFQRKLVNQPKKFRFVLDDAQAAAFYVFLIRMPLDKDDVYQTVIRQKLCDHLFSELFGDMPEPTDPVPLTEVDYYQMFFEV